MQRLNHTIREQIVEQRQRDEQERLARIQRARDKKDEERATVRVAELLANKEVGTPEWVAAVEHLEAIYPGALIWLVYRLEQRE